MNQNEIASLIIKCPNLNEILYESQISQLSDEKDDTLPTEAKIIYNELQKNPEKNLIQTINWISSLKNEYIIVKGHIQSGKTNFMVRMSNLLVSIGFNVIIVLRNNDADRRQFESHFISFHNSVEHLENLEKQKKSNVLVKANSKKMNMKNDSTKIFLMLGNESNLKKMHIALEKTERKYVVFIDEVDAIDTGNKSKKSRILSLIKEKAYCVFGVSGTVMDQIAKEEVQIKNFITLKTPLDYKGIFNGRISMRSDVNEEFYFEEKNNVFSGRVDDDLFENTELESFIRHYTSLPQLKHILVFVSLIFQNASSLI